MLDNIEQLWSCCSDGPNITNTNVYWTGLCHFETFHAMVKKNTIFFIISFFFKKKLVKIMILTSFTVCFWAPNGLFLVVFGGQFFNTNTRVMKTTWCFSVVFILITNCCSSWSQICRAIP